MKKHVLLAVFFISLGAVWAQVKSAPTKGDLEAKKAKRQAVADAAQLEADAIQAQIDALPGWKIGAFGIVGGSLSGFNNWYSQALPNNSSGNIGITVNGYAHLIRERFFWRNTLTANLKWIKLDDKDRADDDRSFSPTTDVFGISSLYGLSVTKTWAISTSLEYKTTLLDNVNNPGYLDLGLGATWTPLQNLVVSVFPANYNIIFSKKATAFKSSLGTKLVADYNKKIGNVRFKTNVSVFQSYERQDYSNWTWTNAFSYTLWKMIGVGFDFGLRNNKQEALNNALANTPPTATGLADVDNKLQTFYTLGISYSF